MPITLPKTVTLQGLANGQVGVSDHIAGATRGAIDYLARHGGDGTFWTREVVGLLRQFDLLSEKSTGTAVSAAIYWLGYRPIEEKKHGRGAQYLWKMDPEKDRSTKQSLPLTFLKGEVQVDDEPEVTEEPEVIEEPEVEEIQTDFGTETFVKDERMVTHSENDGHDHGKPSDPATAYTYADVERWFEESVRLEGVVERLTADLSTAIEGQSYQGKAARWWAEACDTVSRERDDYRQRYATSEAAASTLDEERLRLVDVNLALLAERDTLKSQQVNPVETDGWWEIETPLDRTMLDAAHLEQRLQIRRKP